MQHPPEVQLEFWNCPMGCELNDEQLLVGRDRLHKLPGKFPVVRCKTCGLIRTNPRPTQETIGYYYPDTYGPFQSTTQASELQTKLPFWKHTIKSLLQYNLEPIPPISPGKMLEIGCASGRFMNLMAQKGWEVAGIEPDRKSAEKARELGYLVYTGSLEDAPKPALEYDLVVGWMVIEHLHDPVESLKKLYEWVKPGGWLAFSVPNIASLESRIFRSAWYALDVPRHLTHFTPKTIESMLSQSGWRTEHIFHQRSIGNLVASFGYKLEDLGVQGKTSKVLLEFPVGSWRKQQIAYPLAWLMSLFGQTGRMSVWARKS